MRDQFLIHLHVFVFSAKEAGTEMLEIDCHLTEDGQVVVSHDNDLQRVSGLSVLISQTKFHELPQLKQSLSLDFHNSKRKYNLQTGMEVNLAFTDPSWPVNARFTDISFCKVFIL